MTIPDIHHAFADLIEPGNVRKQRLRRKIGMSSRKAAWYRFQLAKGGVSISTKLKWLQSPEIEFYRHLEFSAADMLEFLRFSRRKDAQRAALNLGDAYVLELYQLWLKQGKPAVISTGVAIQ